MSPNCDREVLSHIEAGQSDILLLYSPESISCRRKKGQEKNVIATHILVPLSSDSLCSGGLFFNTCIINYKMPIDTEH